MAGKLKTLKKKQGGFTILEIMAVLVVIGILLSLVIAAYSGVRRGERNQERRRDIQDVYQQLEAYNVLNSKYPTLAEMNDAAWLKANMKTLNRESLRDPSSNSYTLASSPTKDAYAYQPTSATGGACDDIKVNCSHYALTATLENTTPNTYVKTSLY